MDRRPVDIAVNSRAVKVLTDNGRVMGVEAVTPDKKSYMLKAKKVILAASTLETPRILLQSGIKGRAIGHYLIDHIGIFAGGSLNRDEFSEVLGTTDEYGVQKIKVQFSYSEKDKQAARQAVAGIRHLSGIVGSSLSSVLGYPPICLFHPGQERHFAGTCRHRK